MPDDFAPQKADSASAAIDAALQPTPDDESKAKRLDEINELLQDILAQYSHAEIIKAVVDGQNSNEFITALEGFGFTDITDIDDINADDFETETDVALETAMSHLRRGAADDARHHLYTRLPHSCRDLFHPETGLRAR